MSLPIFKNSALINKMQTKFNVCIRQDTNYSDQSELFYRFVISKNKNSPVIGRIIYLNGTFIADGELKQIADAMNQYGTKKANLSVLLTIPLCVIF